jgi:hypothetical protein
MVSISLDDDDSRAMSDVGAMHSSTVISATSKVL